MLLFKQKWVFWLSVDLFDDMNFFNRKGNCNVLKYLLDLFNSKILDGNNLRVGEGAFLGGKILPNLCTHWSMR